MDNKEDIARVADGLIVFHSRGRFVTSVLGIEARCNPRPFCLCLGSRAYISLLHVIVCSHMGTHVLLARRRRLPENKKNKSAKRPMIHLEPKSFFASFILFVVGEPTGSGRQNLALPLYLRSSTYKTLHAMAKDESSKPRVIVSQLPLQHHYSLFRINSYFAIAICPTTPPPPPQTTILLRVTPPGKEASAYATHVGAWNNPMSSRSASVEVVYVTICLFLSRQLNANSMSP